MNIEQTQHLVHTLMWIMITCSYVVGIIGIWRFCMSFLPAPQMRRRRRR